MLVTISGPPGSGTSTAARRLAAAAGLEHVSGGDLFRSLADERGLSLAELNERAETDDTIDRDLDRRLRATAVERDDVVLESRLAGWMAGGHADLKCWLDAPIAVRAERIADREDKSAAAARVETEEREASEAARYAGYYDIDIDDLSIYDLTLNTARWDADGVATLLERAVADATPADDASTFPVAADYDFDDADGHPTDATIPGAEPE
jgi:cytidylate kinase